MTSISYLLILFVSLDFGEQLTVQSFNLVDGKRHRQRYSYPTTILRAEPFQDEVSEEEDESEIEQSDWATGEFTLMNAPEGPSPELDAMAVATICVRSLQWVDYPTKNAGLERCFDFFAWECRKTVTARRGGDTVERFIKHGMLSPALQPFMGAHRVDIGEGTLTPAQPPLRGALLSLPIVIQGAPIFSVQHMSGFDRSGVAAPPETHFVIRLEQQRRPPMQGCWLVREMLDVRHAFAGDMGNAGVGG